MGSRGPMPIPTNLRKLRGTRARTSNRNEPMPKALEDLACPARLKGDARAFWKAHADECVRLGTLTAMDVDTFATACVTYAELRELERVSKRLGIEHAIQKGVRKDLHATRADYLRFSQRFGFDPASRSGIKVTAPAESGDVVDAKERFLGGANRHA